MLEFAIFVWTIPPPVVQIHIAIPATDASGRVERLHHSANSLKRGPPAFHSEPELPGLSVWSISRRLTLLRHFRCTPGITLSSTPQPAETLQSRSRTPITLALKKRRVDELFAHLAGMPF